MHFVLWALAGYLGGSLSGARIAAALTGTKLSVEDMTVIVDGTGTRVDVRGVSPSTLLARAGVRPGVAAAAIDIAKGLIATYLALALGDRPELPVIVASAVLLGHVFPVFHRFRGGFGISPLLGALLVIDPLSAVAAIAVFGVLGVALGNAFVGIESWPLGLIGWFTLFGSEWEIGFAVFANALFWWRTRREAVTAFRSWRSDQRPWRVRVGDFRTYPDYEPPD